MDEVTLLEKLFAFMAFVTCAHCVFHFRRDRNREVGITCLELSGCMLYV